MIAVKPSPTIFLGLPPKLKHVIADGFEITFANDLFGVINKALNISKDQLQSQIRKREFSEARAIFVGMILDHYPNFGLVRLGYILGKRDHSTIIYQRDSYYALTDEKSGNKQFMKKVKLVKDIMNLYET